jgi:hypothetical protein
VEYVCAKSIVIDQNNKSVISYGYWFEHFENRDYSIKHDYEENTTVVLRKERKIDLEVASRFTLKTLDFDKLWRTASLLK